MSLRTLQQDAVVEPFAKAMVLVGSNDLATDQPDAPVIAKAKAIHEALDCDLQLVCCVGEEQLTPATVAAFEERLDDMQQFSASTQGSIACAPDVVEAVVDAAREAEADVILKQVDADNPYFLGIADHVDWRLMRNDAASVWFVKQPGADIDRVVTAVGNSNDAATGEHNYLDERSYRLYSAARQASKGFGSSLQALHVVESGAGELPAYDIALTGNVMSYSGSDSVSGSRHDANAQANYHGRQLRAFAQHIAADGSTLDVRAGSTEDVIAEYAREADADLVVLGARPMSRWQRMRAAPVAEPVLADAPCDVLALQAGNII